MIKPKEMAQRLGVSVKTLQRWDNSGVFVAKRTPTNQRYYTEDQYQEYMGIKPKNNRKVIAYVRVSSNNQKDDLINQEQFIRTYTNVQGIILDETITDVGSGLNYKRKNWNKLLDRVMANEIETIYVTYKDRFVRFGFDWFKQFCQKFNTKIIVINNPETSPQQEMIDDLIAIIHVFSCRIYGLRKYKSKIRGDKEC